MTSSFDEREKAFENKFKHDEEMKFKLNAKAVRALGLWAAGELGLSGKEAEDYAETVVDSDFDEPGIQDVIRKVQKDLSAKGKNLSNEDIEKQFRIQFDEVLKKAV